MGRGLGRQEDYIVGMKRKYSRAGDGARYVGTVLGRHGRDAEEEMVVRSVKIEGGPESLSGWREEIVKRRKLERIRDGERDKDAVANGSAVEMELG